MEFQAQAMLKSLMPLEQLLREDLEYICRSLEREFADMAGSRLLITGGGGFLGYYLVQAALYWNSTRARGNAIAVTVYDNYMRGVPQWLESLRGSSGLSLVRQDMILPLPADMGHFDYIIHAAGIASPTVYRKYPLKTIDANINGLRNLLEHCRTRVNKPNPVRGFSGNAVGKPDSMASHRR